MAKEETSAQQPVVLTAEALKELIALTHQPTQNSSPELIKALESIAAQGRAVTLLQEEVRRTVLRSNADHSHQSVFNFDPRCELCNSGQVHPETGNLGHPKARLRYETYFCFGRQWEDALTPAEIELFNQFESSKESRHGTWQAVLERVGTGGAKRLHIIVPARTSDDLMSLPSLSQVLLELLYGQNVSDPMLALERIKELEREMAELKAAGASGQEPKKAADPTGARR